MSRFTTLLDAPADSAIALEDGAGALRWSDLRRRATHGSSLVASRRRAGVAGPRVALLLEPGADWVASWLAIVQAGAVAVPLSPRYTDRELSALIADADVSLLVHGPGLERDLPCPRLPVAAFLRARSYADPEAAPADADLAMLLYTSGTTGRPKGVRLSHANLFHQLSGLIAAWRLDTRQALLHCLPLHHMHGIAIALWPCLAAGMRVTMLPRFDAPAVWEAMARCDTLMAVPTMYHLLLDAYDAADDDTRTRWRAAARGLGLATSGSAALPVGLAARWSSIGGNIPLERWGMTELGVGCSNPLEPTERRRGWVGTPLSNLALSVRDGELLVRGPGVFDGYWQRPDADAEAFVDGWFRTGDAVERDGDWVRILGRRSVDIIKSGGYKLSALEIEEQLRDHEAVADVAVVGVPDAVYGQRVEAAVVLRAGQQTSDDALRAWAGERLARYKLPRRFVVLEALPRNPLGKVLKRELVTILTARPS